MAATDVAPSRDSAPVTPPVARGLGPLVLAALSLPGVMAPTPAAAEAPEQAEVSVQWAQYRDRQPGLDRLSVHTPSLHGVLPLGPDWSAEGSLTHDDVSGASPRYYTDISGASRFADERRAGDLRVTRHLDGRSLAIGLAGSTENDYRSRALSLTGTQDSTDRNTTWRLGVAVGRDRIDPVNRKVVGATRDTAEWQAGVTQAVSRHDRVQLALTLGRSSGYHDDPYKTYDRRPEARDLRVLSLRWHHGFEGWGGATLRSGWRLYDDSWGVRGHSVDAAWVQPWGERWTLTPSLRLHTQRAARFYIDPASDPTVYPGPIGNPAVYSNDQRLGGFGALTLGFKVEHRLDARWSVDAQLERYGQRSGWRVGGDGSPGLAPLSATIWQFGLTHRY